ncbi:D-alanyl-D-alanine carboxypeptidase [Clostridium botulinum]|uniref:XkdW family protein n=1 Tax=Clostridium botulinum TaxID=1491 RepID=UPI0004658024|nr:XkdW family protein [Clostridium botulinum]AWB17267.1 D-alanyl-D-alanine carboxypeptidase [Clostridium botulinum]EGT5616428.1 D-alanyl-D-alanine carboxypeptidase [Clostridium botulinum]EGT5623181.1 D-alanyl-D-alanine carboxypeptidase [Clostridium botulinum]EGT5626319.1 D-alanyl-D-alanine carboxypeptidase [Clostridium botulinum]EGT5628702.1 D-alanyl-D-alanine carboxypeptidase [Clostridium botulinum]
MGIYINNTIIQEKQKKEKNNITLQSLGQQLTQEKIKNMQKDAIINNLGKELTQIKLEMLQNKGGNL